MHQEPEYQGYLVTPRGRFWIRASETEEKISIDVEHPDQEMRSLAQTKDYEEPHLATEKELKNQNSVWTTRASRSIDTKLEGFWPVLTIDKTNRIGKY